ncbi:BYR3 protein, partial [Acromyrmex heyeri]
MKNNPKKKVANKANKDDTKSVKKEKKTTKLGERCYNCGESGHRSDKCKFRDKGKKCFHCNNFGHESKHCPNKNKSNTTQVMSNILVKAVDVNRTFKQRMHFKTFKTLKLHESEVLLTGTAQGRVKTLGYFQSTVTIDNIIQAEVRISQKKSKQFVQIIDKEAKNVAEAPRRLPLKEKEIVENQVNEWVSEGIIEPCSSEYGSPIMIKDKYPLSVIEDQHVAKEILKIYCVHNLSESISILKVASDYGLDINKGKCQLLSEIILLAHGRGHFSAKRTKEAVKQEYYISMLSKKTEIANCVPCILGNAYPTKSTTSKEVITKLQIQSQTFGNPAGIITDRGTAFSSLEFQNYCEEEGIKHSVTIIPILTKLAMNDPTKWYKCTYSSSDCKFHFS